MTLTNDEKFALLQDMKVIDNNRKIVEQIEKRIKELRYQLDHTEPDYKRSIALQEALQEMVNLIGFEKYEEIMVRENEN